MQLRGCQIDAPAVGVGIVGFQAISAGTHHAGVDDELLQIECSFRLSSRQPVFEMFKDLQFSPGERALETIRETDEKTVLVASRGPRHHADSSARVHQRIIGSAHLNERHDLCPCKDVVRLV
ncbi:hypothetical protein SDC9_187572 [bioreactor metagenome]|uniref:Uncharacterized protein n=1 Tax=bioreactor metagenome TaxID=1076179 RepID=A0A645HM74_9ZZZZ